MDIGILLLVLASFFIFPGFFILIFVIAIVSAIKNTRSNTIRQSAEKKLQEFLKTNKIQLELKNKYLELRLVEKVFYCKERTNGKKEGRFFYVGGNTDHALTAWGLINAIFTQNTKYNDIRNFYLNIGSEEIVNNEFEFVDDYEADMLINPMRRRIGREQAYRRASRRYFHEKNIGNQPDFIMNEAQNEYCRLSLENDNGYFYLVCKEIWGHRNFIIQCEHPEQILQEFRLKQNKMETYTELLRRFKYENRLKIILPNHEKEIKTEQSVQQNVTEIDETAENSYNDEQEIEKTDERNVDL